MRSLRATIVWYCLLIVALPLSPCAFLPSICCQAKEALAEQRAAAPERPCCAQHTEPAGQQSNDGQPCRAECCRIHPFMPTAEKVLLDAPSLTGLAELPPVVTAAVAPLLLAELVPADGPPLQILHCVWRL